MLPQLKSAACGVDKKELLLHGVERGKKLSPGDNARTKQAIMWWEGRGNVKERYYWYFAVLDLVKKEK